MQLLDSARVACATPSVTHARTLWQQGRITSKQSWCAAPNGECATSSLAKLHFDA
ncbi:hypothetical protein PIB30_069808 [Stylosanthes scabra]|uniref:Uncharacterized protein n=1 Tax=Stylosanthes scabra TaxID=79078 RepID=A0ABU6ZLX7_9FABA|nr:hypothetical protein [Stylosanthes scabra]